MQNNNTLGWGKIQENGTEIWDAEPVFKNDQVETKDWLKLLFYPKKWFLYRHIKKHVKTELRWKAVHEVIRILDIGCGTGADVIDFKKMFGRKVEIIGLDVIKMQIDLAREKIKKYGVWAEVLWYDGEVIPFESNYFDAIYTSDVLGHVEDVPSWLGELNRVLKPGGALAMFSESKLGKHAYIRNYLLKRGLNIDPHAEFHISLYSKTDLRRLLKQSGFEVESMRTAFWASFFVHPDEYHGSFDIDRHRFFVLRNLNRIFYWIKNKLHPYSTALCELYGLAEMYLVGKWVEAQGYIILAKKK